MATYTKTQSASRWSLSRILARREAKEYINPYLAGILLGIVLFSVFFLTGGGLGASGGMNNLVVMAEDAIAPNHVDRTAYLLGIAGGSKNPLDSWTVWMLFGVVIGGFVSGWLNGRLKIETNKGPRISSRTRWGMAFFGGALMG